MSEWIDLLDLRDHNPKANPDGTAQPTVNNDDSPGEDYAIGSRWTDATNDKDYVCTDASTGAANWVETTATGGGSVDTTGWGQWECVSVASAVPSAGEFSVDSATLSSITEILIHDNSSDINFGIPIEEIGNGDQFWFREVGGATYCRFNVTGNVDNTAYHTIDIQYSGGSGTVSTSTDYSVDFYSAGGGAGGPAEDLATDGTPVEIDSTAPPGADYVLKSTSTTVATWQAASTPSGLLATCMAVTSGATVIPETFTALAFVATPEVETDATVIELTSTTTFTLKKTGAYQLTFTGVLDRPTTGNVAQFKFRVNDSTDITGGWHSAHVTGAMLSVVSLTVVYEATADDTLTLEIDGDASSDYEIHDGANMTVTFFG
jgi:hypothetical protein